MKLIEALKELKMIKKKLNSNIELIQTYSSYCNLAGPEFDTHEKQVEEVKKLQQSSKDLVDRYLKLKSQIDFTNLKTTVNIKGVDSSISNLIQMRKGKGAQGHMGEALLQVLGHQSTATARNQLGQFTRSGLPESGFELIKCYSEEDKNKQIEFWTEFLELIDSKLEVVNATTDLIEEV